jgi:hypothetical protein
LPPQWATTEAARQGPEGQIKNYSHDNLLKETELSSSGWKYNGQRQPAKKSTTVEKKGKTLTLCSNLEIAEGGDVVIDEDVDE